MLDPCGQKHVETFSAIFLYKYFRKDFVHFVDYRHELHFIVLLFTPFVHVEGEYIHTYIHIYIP
jgi:hypothetical protein